MTSESEDRPKSAVELAMERLRRKDTDEGVAGPPPSEAQKAAIAELRSVHAAKMAELEILHRAKLAGLFDPAARMQADEAYRRDLNRLNDDFERKIGQVRAQKG